MERVQTPILFRESSFGKCAALPSHSSTHAEALRDAKRQIFCSAQPTNSVVDTTRAHTRVQSVQQQSCKRGGTRSNPRMIERRLATGAIAEVPFIKSRNATLALAAAYT